MTRLIKHFNSLNKILHDDLIKEVLEVYNNWVMYQSSIIDGNEMVGRPHHLKTKTNSGMGHKPPDIYKVPITYDQHQDHHMHYPKYQQLMEKKIVDLHEQFLEDNPGIVKKLEEVNGRQS